MGDVSLLLCQARLAPGSGRPGRIVPAIGALILAIVAGVSGARAQTAGSEALAEVNGVAITAREVERSLGPRLSQLEEQIYTLKRNELDSLITRRLLEQEAAKRGVSVATLLDDEVTSKVALVTEKEIDDYYKANKARLRGDEASARAQVRGQLQQRKLEARREAFVASLRSQAKIAIRLEAPATARVALTVDGAPVRGAPDAPVTIVEFSDFECPFCKRSNETMASIMEKFPGKVRLVYRDFPLEKIHPQARRAAEAARCAHDAGKFWEYHDRLFAQAPKLGPDDLRRYAVEIGLDPAKFDACLASGIHRAGVQKDLDEGTGLGITGTPVFFVNGRMVRGAQPIEAFTRLIEDELARTASAATPSAGAPSRPR